MGDFDDCVPWNGDPKTLVEYVKILAPIPPEDEPEFHKRRFRLKDLIQQYEVMDNNADPIGTKFVKPSDLLKQGGEKPQVVGVTINEGLFTRLALNFGKNFIKFGRIVDPQEVDGKELNRYEWKTKYGTDALKVYFLKRCVRIKGHILGEHEEHGERREHEEHGERREHEEHGERREH
jgi:hypothetical protein